MFMTSQIIPLLGVVSPGYTAPHLRNITISATRGGQQTSDYKEAVLWDSLQGRAALVVLPLKNGLTASRTFVASAVDGKKALILYDFDVQPYGVVRTPNITQDLVLNIDLNDGTGGDGGIPTDPASINAVVRVDKLPAVREIVMIEKSSTGEWRMAGNQILQESGELEMQITGGQVFAIGLDDYGRPFQSGLIIEVGQAIRPGNFQGWLYRCTEPGTLPENEPDWWLEQGENPPRLVGTARLQAIRYYQPIAHGPIHYELI